MKVIGIDGGIASVGWAVLDIDWDAGTFGIAAAGVRAFDAPETDKDRTPTNAIRRQHRGQRRIIRRRRQRMNEIRGLFHEHGLLPDSGKQALAIKALDPWTLRAAALDRALTGPELAVALGHIARHRGFRSNAKRDLSANATDETGKVKAGIAAVRERLQGWRTVGEMFAMDPEFRQRKRNRGDYSRSVQRSDLEWEVRRIFEAQRRCGNSLASPTLQEDFARVAFFQRPLQDSEHMVKVCRFEPDQKCTARRSYAFEMFRLLTKLANIRLLCDGQEQKLDVQQIRAVADVFGEAQGITWKALRKLLDLDKRTRFAGIAEKDESQDIVARSGKAAEGTWALKEVVGPSGWRVLMHNPVLRDRIAEVLTFRESPESIRAGLVEAGLDGPLLDAVIHGLETGKFAAFTKAGHISAKAARQLIEKLATGLDYTQACAELGWNHAEQAEVNLTDVRNPVARKAVSEILKQVQAVIKAHGKPDAIHIELARDVGKGPEERDKITKGNEEQNKKRDKARERFQELLGRPPRGEELLRFELWEEQGGECLYTGEHIDPAWLVADDNRVQVDHILPWSRFGDDSFRNKTLCLAKANQDKKNRTPFEWFSEAGLEWELYARRVDKCSGMHPKKKSGFYLRKNAEEVEKRFRERNLNDTRYATSLAMALLKRRYPDVEVRARPGALTSRLRRAWGLEALKKDAQGNRLEDDRHHAVDAIVVAATTESMLQQMTKAAQEAERKGLPRGFDFAELRPPALGFREAVQATIDGVFVSRPERRRARGEAHAATIKRVEFVDGAPVVFERKAIDKLTLADLDKIPVPEPYGRIADPAKLRDALVAELRRWIEAGKPKDDRPKGPNGAEVRKVRIATRDKPAVAVRGGTADRGDMVRVDVFAKPNKKGVDQYYLVPIYPHQVADKARYPTPPDRAVVAHEEEENWTLVDSTFQFKFSLYANSLIEVVKADGEIIEGYFKGLHRGTGAIAIAPHLNSRAVRGGIGAKTLSRFMKLKVDRLGTVTASGPEVRTWHGAAFT